MTWRHVTGPADGAPLRVCCFPSLALAIALNFALTMSGFKNKCSSVDLKIKCSKLELGPSSDLATHTAPLTHTVPVIEKEGECVPATSSFLRDDGTTASWKFVWLLPLERAQSLDENE